MHRLSCDRPHLARKIVHEFRIAGASNIFAEHVDARLQMEGKYMDKQHLVSMILDLDLHRIERNRMPSTRAK